MTETFAPKKGSKKSVVLIQYPRKGTWAVGFATKENKGEVDPCQSFLEDSFRTIYEVPAQSLNRD